MPDPLSFFFADYVDGSPWDPADFNGLTIASQQFQDVWEVRHDTSGYHTRDPLIPLESAFVHWSGAAYSITETTGDASLAIVSHPAVGFIEMSLSAMSNTSYTPMVDVVPSGTEVPYFYEDANYAKTTTKFQIILFRNDGAFVDRDFMVHIFGTRL